MKILAVEDGSFRSQTERFKRGRAYLVGVVVDGFRVDDVLLSYIVVDGLDATERLVEMSEGRAEHLDAIMLASVSCGGFNLIDVVKVYNQLKLPVIIANPKKADMRSVENAVRKHFPDWEKRLTIIQKAGRPHTVKVNTGGMVHFYTQGIRVKEAQKLISDLTIFGNRPEPLRIARLIAHGLGRVSRGQVSVGAKLR